MGKLKNKYLKEIEEIEGEEWRVILDFPNYEISNKGRLRSIKLSVKLYIKGNIKGSGYLQDSITDKNGKNRFIQRHRLVAIAFIDNPNNLPQVNHKDGNKLNNIIENLEWVTASENIKHAFDIGIKNLKGEKNNMAKLNMDIVNEIRELANTDITLTKIAKLYNISIATVSLIVARKRWNY